MNRPHPGPEEPDLAALITRVEDVLAGNASSARVEYLLAQVVDRLDSIVVRLAALSSSREDETAALGSLVLDDAEREAEKADEIKRIDAVVYRTDEGWFGATLQHWIFCQSDSRDGVYIELDRVIKAHVNFARRRGRKPYLSLPQAPMKFWAMYNRPEFVDGRELTIYVSEAEVIVNVRECSS